MSLRERRQEEQTQDRRKKLWNAMILIVATILFIGSICYLVNYYLKLRRSEQQFETLRETETTEITEDVLQPETETETENKVYCEPLYDFSELREQNEDIYAWITVPGTQVDYPILQCDTDNYYLDYNLDHSKGYPGCIYTNQCNSQDFSDYNTVLYGHNMKNGSMFGCLHAFEDESFFCENRQIVVYTEDRRLTYEICAAVNFTDVYIPAYYEVQSVFGRDEFWQAVVEESVGSDVSHILEGVEIASEDQLITLSTCVNGQRERRYLVIGRLQEEAFYIEN